MFRHTSRARLARDAARRPPAADHVICDAVCDAEQIIRHAWEATLRDRAQRMDCAVRAALANRDTADQLMAMAQRDGDPGEIYIARANLDEAAGLARRSSAAAECIRHALLTEFGLLARTGEQHAQAAATRHVDWADPAATARDRESTAAPAQRPRSHAASRRLARGWGWLTENLAWLMLAPRFGDTGGRRRSRGPRLKP